MLNLIIYILYILGFCIVPVIVRIIEDKKMALWELLYIAIFWPVVVVVTLLSRKI